MGGVGVGVGGDGLQVHHPDEAENLSLLQVKNYEILTTRMSTQKEFHSLKLLTVTNAIYKVKSISSPDHHKLQINQSHIFLSGQNKLSSSKK